MFGQCVVGGGWKCQVSTFTFHVSLNSHHSVHAVGERSACAASAFFATHPLHPVKVIDGVVDRMNSVTHIVHKH